MGDDKKDSANTSKDKEQGKQEKRFQKPLNKKRVVAELDEVAKKAGLSKKIDWMRPISPEDIQYILERWPFLEIRKPNATEEDIHEVEFFTAMSNWLVHDHGNVIASSPGIFLYRGGYYYVDWGDEDSGSSDAGDFVRRGIVNPKKGTIINQMYWTAVDMVNLAIHRKWKGIDIIGGHSRMKWAAWIHAEKYRLKVTGYQPTAEEIKKAKRLAKSREEVDKFLRKKRQAHQRGDDPERLEY